MSSYKGRLFHYPHKLHTSICNYENHHIIIYLLSAHFYDTYIQSYLYVERYIYAVFMQYGQLNKQDEL